MNFTNEQIAKIKAAKSAEELLVIAKEFGINVTDEEATKYYDEWHKVGELAEDELDNVSGGCGGSKTPDPKYYAGQTLWVGYPTTRNFLKVVVRWPEFYTKSNGWRYYVTNEYGLDENYYLETDKYVLTYDPGKKWPF